MGSEPAASSLQSVRVGRDFSVTPADADPADGSGQDGRSSHPARGTSTCIRVIGWSVFTSQAIALVVTSTIQYRRFSVGQDFGAYTQALWKISNGHLDPWSSFFSVPFWRNDGEFAMWPLAVVFRSYPHPLALLWLQDVLLVATEAIAFAWILAILAKADGMSERTRRLIAVGAIAVLVLNPIVYDTAAYDFHLEPLLGLLAVLVGKSLWASRRRPLWLLVPALLLTNLLGGLCLAGLGVASAVSSRVTRRLGMALAATGLAWAGIMTSIGAGGLAANSANSGYAYLTEHRVGSVDIFDVLAGALRHPSLVAHMVGTRWPLIVAVLACGGLVGIASPWAFWPGLMLLTPSVLYADPAFIRYSFQSWPIVPLVAVGSVLLLIRVSAFERRKWRQVALGAVAATLVLSLGAVSWERLPRVFHGWVPITGPAAAVLSASADPGRLPHTAEVIASMSIVGRFAERANVFPLRYQDHPPGGGPFHFPVLSKQVIFVIAYQQSSYQWDEPPQRIASWLRYVRTVLGAKTLGAGHGVAVLRWDPAPGTREVTLPSR